MSLLSLAANRSNPSPEGFSGTNQLKKQLAGISEAIAPLLQSPNSWERLEAARLALAIHGILVPESGRITDPKAEAASRHIREVVMGRIWKNSEIRKRINRRAHLKRKIKGLEESGSDAALLEQCRSELKQLQAIRKKVPGGVQGTVRVQEGTVRASDASGLGMDPSFDLEAARAQARAYMLERQRLMENND